MRTFTVGETDVYEGFDRHVIHNAPEFLGLVYYDGEPEIWSLDGGSGWDYYGKAVNPKAVSELERYYKEQCDRKVKVHVYQNIVGH